MRLEHYSVSMQLKFHVACLSKEKTFQMTGFNYKLFTVL